ncbi:MAG TPA: formylglycine-generating enzyme family protein [Anaerolineales bacterium]|nr:formylglycine-generating enzyme family protein [Anaerolineales bacterium]
MKRFIAVFLLFLLAACTATATRVPVIESTATPFPTSIPPTAVPTSIIEPVSSTAAQTATQEVVTERVSPIDGMPQIYIPTGTFRMGGLDVRRAPNEIPEHDVTLDAFWMDQLEVTNAMYGLCVNAGGCTPPQNFKSQRRSSYFNNPDFNDYPVVYVTWEQAKSYCEWAGRRLPTEAEWERAGRGDDFRTFPWGEDKADGLLANFNMLVGDTSRVGTYRAGASPFGVLDMAGNVAEWVNDFYSFNYSSLETNLNPTGPVTSSSLNRVVRGGSLGDAEINIRVSKRSSVLGSNLNATPGSNAYLGDFSPRIGFRCAADEK